MNTDITNEIEKTVEVVETKSDDMIIDELAKLPLLEYERQRKSSAETLGIKRVSMLDKLVKQRKTELETETGSDELLKGIEPWEHAVDGQVLASTIINTFHRYTVLPDGGDVALTLWTLGSYCFNAFRIFPKLCLSSPEKRCGKTTTMETLAAMAHRSLMASNVSPSTLFRSIEYWQPSLLIDEGDTFIASNEELRGIINSGHTRSGASVLRCTGDDHEPKQFSTWAPMAIAMIKTPPDTIKDRSVMVTLRRKMPGENVTRLPIEMADLFKDNRRQCQRWALDYMEALKQAEPNIPKVGNDRAEDNWWALLAVADCLEGEWPTLARSAMLTIEGSKESDDEGIGPMILADIQIIFSEKRLDKITSSELVDELVGLEERPWCEWKHGKPMTKTSLAKMLRPYGIKSKNVRDGYVVKKGYSTDDFQDAFKRYLLTSPKIAATAATTLQNGYSSVTTGIDDVAEKKGVAARNATQNKALHDPLHSSPLTTGPVAICSGVADKSGSTGMCNTGNDEREDFSL
ncbi:MAG: DUF3631 domain-containing protein [Pseudomonadales bacterium]